MVRHLRFILGYPSERVSRVEDDLANAIAATTSELGYSHGSPDMPAYRGGA
jgi:hypothetical protein